MPAFAKASARQASSPVLFVKAPGTPLFPLLPSPPSSNEGARNAGATTAPQPCVCVSKIRRLATTKLPDPRRSARGVYKVCSAKPPVDLPFRQPPSLFFRIGGLPIHRFGARNGLTFKPRPVVSPSIDGPRDARRCAGTKRLGPPMGLLRRISDTPTGHRSPPQRLMTLIKRPSQMGRDALFIIHNRNYVNRLFSRD